MHLCGYLFNFLKTQLSDYFFFFDFSIFILVSNVLSLVSEVPVLLEILVYSQTPGTENNNPSL